MMWKVTLFKVDWKFKGELLSFYYGGNFCVLEKKGCREKLSFGNFIKA
jgi:hypothetical protein